ncbi:MAG: SPOR domain-containing protein [Gammaproteobacteria bacterium]|nr:SPOR domain-containing protein [Gammaproteobacteria bacterium]
MERKLQERMVGAGVLIVALVVLGPLILDGGPQPEREAATVPGQRADEVRTQTFRLGEARPTAPAPAPPPVREPEAAADVAGSQLPALAQPPEPPPAPAVPPREAAVPPKPATVASPSTPASAPPVAEAAAAAPPQRAPATGSGFVVQVGTFGQRANAERLVATLRGKGFEAYVSPLERGGKTLYRVRVGPAGSRQTASDLARRLSAAGQPGQLVAA